jgi:2,3-bisphosphoglycerate-independent phosphoglycerate mutase
MKYLFIVGDGMADEPVPSIGGKTPLEAADIGCMDQMAKNGMVGMCRTVPPGMPPGSDVANLSLLGFDPSKYYTGRGPLEASSMGIDLGIDDCAFRCNLVTVTDGKMADYSAGHISTAEAEAIITDLNSELADESVHFYTGVSYRHICVVKGNFRRLSCTPPHDITGKDVEAHLPAGEGASSALELMVKSADMLKNSPVNRERIKKGKAPATQIWLWGQGYSPKLPVFSDKFGVKGSVVTAVDLIKGIGYLAGLEIIEVEGATGFIDTNYEGKADAALGSLKEKDFVFIHVEAPDEAGHSGDVDMKIKAIEYFDERLLKRIIDKIKGDYRVLVMPDHPTPVGIKTHTSNPVPFILYGKGIKANGIDVYTEAAAAKSELFVEKGHSLIDLLFE